MSDAIISPKDARFDYDGRTLDNRPLVKVDDHTSSSQCGRIYFALDARRIVVDHIGLHDRYYISSRSAGLRLHALRLIADRLARSACRVHLGVHAGPSPTRVVMAAAPP